MLSHKLKINREDTLFLTFTTAEPETKSQMFPTKAILNHYFPEKCFKEIRGGVPCPDFKDTARGCSGIEGPSVQPTHI